MVEKKAIKLIIVDDEGDQSEPLFVWGPSWVYVDTFITDNTMYCEKCNKTLLLSKTSAEPDTCEKCLNKEYDSYMTRES